MKKLLNGFKRSDGIRTGERMIKSNVRKFSLKNIAWAPLIGSLLIFIGFLIVFSSIFSGVIFLFLGVLYFEFTRALLEQVIKRTISLKWRIIVTIVGVLLAIMLVGDANERYKIPVYQGDGDSDEVVDVARAFIDMTQDLQEAQMETLALLSVDLEKADKNEYLDYIKDTEDTWEDVEDHAKKLNKIKKNAPKEDPSKPVAYDSSILNVAAHAQDIDFGDGFESGEIQEVSVGDEEGQVFEHIVDEAYAFKSLHPSETSIGYLQDHLKITARGAQDVLSQYRKKQKNEWDSVDQRYANATWAAQKIAGTSKMSLMVLGSAASFGAAAAATSGTGVVLGYIGAGWGAALSAADIGLEISEASSVVMTGKGLVSYEKDKATIGEISKYYSIANAGVSLGVGGVPTFKDSNQFVNANDFATYFGLGEVAANMALELDDDVVRMQIGSTVSLGEKTSLNDIVRAYHKEEFEYHAVSVRGMPGATQQELEVAQNAQGGGSCNFDTETAQAVDANESLKNVSWPACKRGMFSARSCAHLSNTCEYKGRCVCNIGYIAVQDEGDQVKACVTQEQWEGLMMGGLVDGLAKVGKDLCAKAREMNRDVSLEIFHILQPGCTNYTDEEVKEVDPEMSALQESLNSSELAEFNRRARKCDL